MPQISQCRWQTYRIDVLTLNSIKYESALSQIVADLLVILLHSLIKKGRTQHIYAL